MGEMSGEHVPPPHEAPHFHGRSPFGENFNSTNPVFIICIIFFLILVGWCITMNYIIILALLKRRDSVWDLYFVNMDILDVISGVFIFPLMSASVLLGYFPFGPVVCHLWVFLDYFLVVSSAFGCMAIMINFLWMETWPESYAKITRQTHIRLIISLSVAVLVVWLPPYVHDRFTNEFETTNCGYDIIHIPVYSMYLATMGFYLPLLISLAAMVGYLVILKRNQTESTLAEIFDKQNPVKIFYIRNSRVTNNLHISWNDNLEDIYRMGRIEEIQRAGKEQVSSVLGLFALFIYSRIPFYFFFGVSAYAGFWLWDVSNWVFWVMHSNAVISPIVHLTFDQGLRNQVKKYVMWNNIE